MQIMITSSSICPEGRKATIATFMKEDMIYILHVGKFHYKTTSQVGRLDLCLFRLSGHEPGTIVVELLCQ